MSHLQWTHADLLLWLTYSYSYPLVFLYLRVHEVRLYHFALCAVYMNPTLTNDIRHYYLSLSNVYESHTYLTAILSVQKFLCWTGIKPTCLIRVGPNLDPTPLRLSLAIHILCSLFCALWGTTDPPPPQFPLKTMWALKRLQRTPPPPPPHRW